MIKRVPREGKAFLSAQIPDDQAHGRVVESNIVHMKIYANRHRACRFENAGAITLNQTCLADIRIAAEHNLEHARRGFFDLRGRDIRRERGGDDTDQFVNVERFLEIVLHERKFRQGF